MSRNAAPVLRPVSLAEAMQYSPWPARLMNLVDWSRPQRDPGEILREYEDGWYAPLLALWERFSTTLVDEEGPSVVTRFIRLANLESAEIVRRNSAVYVADPDSYLFSAGDELFVGDLVIGSTIHLDMILQAVGHVIGPRDIKIIVEPGCGFGIVLFHLYAGLSLDAVYGGDICTSAVRLASAIARRGRVPGRFDDFDYRAPERLERITEGLNNYLLLTAHSIEQTQVQETHFIDAVCGLRNPPSLVIHFEPVLWDDGSLMDILCRRYAERNGYNLDLWRTLRDVESKGQIRVLDVSKRVFGYSAFNPTSIISWEPVNRA